jgi:hypothetical protein
MRRAVNEDRVFCKEAGTTDETQTQITQPHEANPCTSINSLQIDDVDVLICGFSNGKILKLNYNTNSHIVKTVIDQCEEALH